MILTSAVDEVVVSEGAGDAGVAEDAEVAGDADGALTLGFGDSPLQPMLQRCAASVREYATRNRSFARIVRRIRASRLCR
jgi:hypothetical protein